MVRELYRLRGVTAAALIATLAQALTGCAAGRRLAYTPSALKLELSKRLPAELADQAVVPFEVDDAAARKAQRIVNYGLADQGYGIAKAMFEVDGFALEHVLVGTHTARETLAVGSGDCLSLASVLVGLARSAGLKAYYLDVSQRFSTTHHDGNRIVRSGHITAIVLTDRGLTGLDFSGFRKRHYHHVVIDDLTAVAHFYNNRGYERLHRAEQSGRAVDWQAVATDFRLATHVAPDFARAWNNLGVSYVHLGRTPDAESAYRRAISMAPDIASPHFNLGILLLRRGDAGGAVAALERAIQLDPNSEHVRQEHAAALEAAGPREPERNR